MKNTAQKVVVVTGTSSGIGKLTAIQLATQGHAVYATMRDPQGKNRTAREDLIGFAESKGYALRVQDIDVTDDASVSAGIETILDEGGRIDVVVNNAGVMNVGVSEAYTLDEVKRQFDVNVYGIVRMNRAVLPHMRARRSGLLIHMSSIVGRVVIPFFGLYCASKFAVEALAESYRYELASFDVDSVIVEPGPFGTELFGNSPSTAADPERASSYGDAAAIPAAIMTNFEEFLASAEAPGPDQVATAIGELVDMSGERPLRTVVGIDYGVRELNRAAEPFQLGLLEGLGMSHVA